MRLLLLCAALGYAHACSTSGAIPCDGYIQADIKVTVLGSQDNCSQTAASVGNALVDFLNVNEAQVQLKDNCGGRFTIYNLEVDQYGFATDIQADESDFASALRAELTFDDVVVEVEKSLEEDLPCNGGSLYFVNEEFVKGTETANKYPVYENGNAAIFFSKDGEWVYQIGATDPISYNAECEPADDPTDECNCGTILGSVDVDGCDGYDEYIYELEQTIEQLDTDLNVCLANGGSAGNCSDELRTPIFVDNEWWYCDELIQSDCEDPTHGDAVSAHCPGTCGTCAEAAVAAVCGEKYHTKVFIPNIGSLYCDQLYPEECLEPGVAETCCATCP